MLHLGAKAISNPRAQHPQLPSQPGPSSIQEAKDHPSWNKGRQSFSTTATQRKYLPSHPQSSRFWTSQGKHSHCVSKERPRGSGSSFETFCGANVTFKLEIFILMKKLLIATLSTILSFASFSQTPCNFKRKNDVRGWAEPWTQISPSVLGAGDAEGQLLSSFVRTSRLLKFSQTSKSVHYTQLHSSHNQGSRKKIQLQMTKGWVT